MRTTNAILKSLGFGLGLISLAASLVGCSYQYREADPQISGKEVFESLRSIQSEMSVMGGGGTDSQFFALVDDVSSVVYFADGPGPLGPVISVFSLASFDFLGSEIASAYIEDIEKVHIYFVDRLTDSGHECGLLVDIKLVGSSQFVSKTFVSTAPGQVAGGEYACELQGDSGVRMVLRSRDVSGGDLKKVIQFRMSVFDEFGVEQDNGKFSTLVGFGS